jgi:preprotein translocase subunit SecE
VSVLALAGIVAMVLVAAALVVWREQVKASARATGVFMGEVQSEVKKVTWPDRQQLKSMTWLILVFVAIVAMLIGLMDVILQLIFTNWLPRWFG